MAYATVANVQARMTRALSETEQIACTELLNEAAVLIDLCNPKATIDVKEIVSCRMVVRAMSADMDVPMGATQGSMSALGYTQSWTIGTGGSAGELYLSKTDKKLLGGGNAIGSYSPVLELVPEVQR